jgi:hypothetical protein
MPRADRGRKRTPPPLNGHKRPYSGLRAGSGRWDSGPAQCSICTHPQRARIDYLLASGASAGATAKQFGVVQQSVTRHFERHVGERFKQMCSAQHLASFEEMLRDATEANAETVDILNLLIRGHAQRWAVCLEAGADKAMSGHAAKVLQAIELRSRITLELQPETRNLTVNNYLVRDAAALVNTLRDNPEAVAAVEHWYRERMDNPKLIEHAAAAD